MFQRQNVPALFKKGTLKLVQGDGSVKRVAEAMCVIEPFPADLARELGDIYAGHLFDGSDDLRPEVDSIDLRVRCGLQHAIVRHHEDLDALVRLEPVSIKDVSVERIEPKTGKPWLSCSFVLVFSLEEKAARNFVLDEFGKTLLWTFEAMQEDLLDESGRRGIESVTFSSPGHEPVTITQADAQNIRRAIRKTH